jgi:putative holliday junction resolvase
MGRIAGIDYGLRRIGVALSDSMKILASPLQTIETGGKPEEAVQRVLTLLSESDVERIVVGLPLMLSGSAGSQAELVRKFIALLRNATPIEVVEWDERLTSRQAERAMQEGGMSRKKRAKRVDAMAAVLILQSYLDALT